MHDDDTPPASELETLEERLELIENLAWEGRATAVACRFLLGNLLLELHKTGVIDVPPFIGRLQQALTSNGMDASLCIAAGSMLGTLQAQLAFSSDTEGTGNPPPVFH